MNPFDRPMYYILDDNKLVVPARDHWEWASWFDKPDRIVRQEEIGTAWVSTVFLGMDMNWSMEGPPIVFETMIFPTDAWDDYTDRCATYEEALAMHVTACAHVRQTQRQLPVVIHETN